MPLSLLRGQRQGVVVDTITLPLHRLVVIPEACANVYGIQQYGQMRLVLLLCFVPKMMSEKTGSKNSIFRVDKG